MKRIGWWDIRKEAASMQKPVWDIHSRLPFRPRVLKMRANLLDFFSHLIKQPHLQWEYQGGED